MKHLDLGLVILIFVSLFIISCGHKGPLYLPSKETNQGNIKK